MDLWEKQGLCHSSAKYPWVILLLSLWGPTSICVNSYQADGGADIKTWAVGYILASIMFMGIYFWWVLLVPALIALICYALGIWHGYCVF